ncbi:hypothetical protein ILUMI_09705, partial [Ignelater luminosus]
MATQGEISQESNNFVDTNNLKETNNINNLETTIDEELEDKKYAGTNSGGGVVNNVDPIDINNRDSTDDKRCMKCNFIPKNKSQLRRHLKEVHDIKLYKCDYCEYRTSDKAYLTTHLVSHAGQKPFECDSCNFKTAKKYLLNRHLKIHT